MCKTPKPAGPAGRPGGKFSVVGFLWSENVHFQKIGKALKCRTESGAPKFSVFRDFRGS